MKRFQIAVLAGLMVSAMTAFAGDADPDYSVEMKLYQHAKGEKVLVDGRVDNVRSGSLLVSGLEIGQATADDLPRRSEAQITVNGEESLSVAYQYEAVLGAIEFEQSARAPLWVTDTTTLRYEGEYKIGEPVTMTSRDGRYELSVVVRENQPLALAMEKR